MKGLHQITRLRLYFIPIQTRVPLKFGPETLTSVTCARVWIQVVDEAGKSAEGWGETPLSVQWAWPSALPYSARHHRMRAFCERLAHMWLLFPAQGHPLKIGEQFLSEQLPKLMENSTVHGQDPLPYLAALVCCSAFDLALHDAFGNLVDRPVYTTYTKEWLQRDLAGLLEPARASEVSFSGKFPSDYFPSKPRTHLPAWHLVGGLDPLEPGELTGSEPDDGHPVLLEDWIRRDGLQCTKVKLRGNDACWDYQRLVRVGEIALRCGVEKLSADFNCTVSDPDYVNGILDRLGKENASIHSHLLYVEQPFPYDLHQHPIDVHGVSRRKPLFLDESAHDWRLVRYGRELGWTGVALKTCKTQTGAILSGCWARAHGMDLMVQDLTNPMLAQIPHLLLASHFPTIMGVETNSMQFYPSASAPEADGHPGIYQRRGGCVDLSSIRGPGFGYRVHEIRRELPRPALELG